MSNSTQIANMALYYPAIEAATVPDHVIADRVPRLLADLPYQPDPRRTVTRPLAVRGDVYAAMGTLGARLLRLLARVVRYSADTDPMRHRVLRMHPRLEQLFVEAVFEQRYATCIARPDVLLTGDGIRFIEFNVSAAAGGMTHAHLLTRLWRSCYGRRPPFAAIDPLDRRSDFLADVCSLLGLPSRVVILARPTDVGVMSDRYYQLEVDQLRSRGFTAEFRQAAPEGESGGLVVRRAVPQEWLDAGLPVVSLATHPGWWPVSPYSSYMLGNKLTLAALSELPGWLTRAESALVAEYVPWTRAVRAGFTDYAGRRYDLLDLLLKRQENFVLKHATGNGGTSVHMGRAEPPTCWVSLVEKALRDGDWVVQRYMEGQPAPVHVYDPLEQSRTVVSAPVVLSPCLIGGRLAGCQARYRIETATDARDTVTTDVLGMRLPGMQIGIVVSR
jgi:hypothetical protein